MTGNEKWTINNWNTALRSTVYSYFVMLNRGNKTSQSTELTYLNVSIIRKVTVKQNLL